MRAICIGFMWAPLMAVAFIQLLSAQPAVTEREAAAGDSAPRGDERRATVEATTIVNPLANYLARWMTPRDYAILRPQLESGARRVPAGGDQSKVTFTGRPPIVQNQKKSELTSAGGVGALSGTGDNPYLRALAPAWETPPVSPPAANSPSESLAPIPSVAAGSTETVTPPSPEKVTLPPEFLRRASDAKYFPQLKHF